MQPIFVKKNFIMKVSWRKAYICEKFFCIKVSQRAAIDNIIFPCPYWYIAYVFILILVFMISKKFEKKEKIGATYFLDGCGGRGGNNMPQRAPKHTTYEVRLFL